MVKHTIAMYIWLVINLANPLNLYCKLKTQSKSQIQKTTNSSLAKKSKTLIQEISNKSEIKTGKNTILEFYSQKCGACIMFKKTYEKLAKKYNDVTFLKVDGMKHLDLLKKYKIKAFPTFIFINASGKVVQTIIGANQEEVENQLRKMEGKPAKKPLKSSGGKGSSKPKRKGTQTVSTLAELDSLIQNSEDPVVVDYHAEAWCGACKMFKPVFEELSNNYGDVAIFVKINGNTPEGQVIGKKHEIKALPTTLIFKDKNGKTPVEKVVGANKKEVEKAIKKHTGKKSSSKKSKPTKKAKPAKKSKTSKKTKSKPKEIVHIKSKLHLEDLIQSSKEPVVVDYHAEAWCGACKMYKGIFESLAKQHPKLIFAKADHNIKENQAIANDYGIQAFPTTLFFHKGKKVKNVVGINMNDLNKTMSDLELDS